MGATPAPPLFLTLIAVCTMPCATIAAQHDARHRSTGFDGEAVRAVSFANSGAPAAQPSFLRGLALLHNFEYPDAATAFAKHRRAIPDSPWRTGVRR
jgi:hypothetical protein